MTNINTAELPDTLNEVLTLTSLTKLMGKKDTPERQKYNNAKGNNEMDISINEQQRTNDALDTVLPLIKDSKIAEIRAMLNSNEPIYILPVQQKESRGQNKIPRQYANILTNKLNA